MIVLGALLALCTYFLLGLIACLLVDASRKHGGAVRDLSIAGELLTLAAWPFALPMLMYANPERRRR